MKKAAVALSIATALVLGVGSTCARADTLAENFTFSDLPSDTTGFTSSVPLFNADLGTLTGVSLIYSGSGNVPSSDPNNPDFMDFQLNVPGLSAGQLLDAAPGNTFSLSGSNSTSDATVLVGLTGDGSFDADYTFYADSGTVLDTLNATLTYTYTPNAAPGVTPEPSSLALLGSGILGLGGVLRRRFLRA